MGKRDRLLLQIREAEARFQRLGVRLGKLKLAREMETRIEEHLRMGVVIADAETQRLAAGAELESLESQLSTHAPAEWLAQREQTARPPLVYWSYAPIDEALRDELVRQAEALAGSEGPVYYHDRRVALGEEPARLAAQQLASARVILLLVSADYLADEWIDRNEVQPAMRRSATGQAIVIPIILRACMWDDAPFAKLQVLPKDGVPVQSWPDRELVMRDIAAKVHHAAVRLELPSLANS